MTKLFFVTATTGCSCCKSENSIHGPYHSKGDAQSVAKAMHNTSYVSSTFSANGEYALYSADSERLPDGRLIVGGLIFGQYDDDTLGHPDVYIPHLRSATLKLECRSDSKWFL